MLPRAGNELLACVQFFEDNIYIKKKKYRSIFISLFPSQSPAAGVKFEKEIFHFKWFVIQVLASVVVWIDVNQAIIL